MDILRRIYKNSILTETELHLIASKHAVVITLPKGQFLLSERQIIQYAPLKHIATYLGITDTSLSRIRKEISS